MKVNKNNIKHFKHKLPKRIYTLFVYILLIEFAFIFIFPFLYMLTNSIKTPQTLADMGSKWIVTSPYFYNYLDVIERMDFIKSFGNTAWITGLSTLGHVISCALVAYGLSRFKFKGSSVIFGLIIFSLIIPPQVLMVPLFLQYSKMKIINTFIPIIAPTFFAMGLKGGVYVFLFRQFFKSLPVELEEAARIDGCGVLRTFINIVLPLAKSPILVTSILSLVWHWNDYFEPSTYLMVAQKAVLSTQLNNVLVDKALNFESASGAIVNPMGMAGAILMILPLLVVYLFLQKEFTAGIERTGLAN